MKTFADIVNEHLIASGEKPLDEELFSVVNESARATASWLRNNKDDVLKDMFGGEHVALTQEESDLRDSCSRL